MLNTYISIELSLIITTRKFSCKVRLIVSLFQIIVRVEINIRISVRLFTLERLINGIVVI